MEKEKYTEPEMKIVIFESEDVITTSDINDDENNFKDPFETPEL